MTIYGVDEAGRGPILGPMVLAVVGLDPPATRRLKSYGVADSKGFGSGATARRRRADLASVVRKYATAYRVREIEVDTIDAYTMRGELNVLEREVAMTLLVELDVAAQARIICDGARMFAPLREMFPKLEAVDRGESAHVCVAAASILAKDARDNAMESIAARYRDEFGPIAGGGYLNAATRRFLSAYRDKRGGLPPEARKSWGAKSK